MKLHRRLPLLLFFFSTTTFAQSVLLRSGALQPPANVRKTVVDSFNRFAPRLAGQTLAVVQFERLPSAAERAQLAAAGIILLDYLPQNTYTVSIRGNVSVGLLQSVAARALFRLQPQQKMQETFARGLIPAWAVKVAGTVDIWISFPKTQDAETVIAALKALNVDLLSDEHKRYGILSLRISSSRLAEIAALPYIEYVQPAPPPAQPLNASSRSLSRAAVLNAPVGAGGRGLNGEGVVLGVGDDADVQEHIDFSGRLINRNYRPAAVHGIHTSGTTAGAGLVDERLRGYAPKATLISQAFNGIVDNAATYVADYGMVLTNNSYGNIIECSYHGTYDLYSRLLDQQALELPNLLTVFAAGNSGAVACGPYAVGFHTVLGGYQSAKNVITAGASTDSGAVAGFSSRGPVKDGRIKPEILAQGQSVISTYPGNGYGFGVGTSMAAPGVTGGLALLYQRYRQLNGGANPKNGLMKALLCNGGTDGGAGGPDFKYGFGNMNLLRSVEALESNRYATGNSLPGATATHAVTVPAGTAQLKVLLYWNDLPASLLSTKTLVNDLDLEVTTPSSSVVLPRIPDTAAVNLDNAATTGADHTNNIEQIVIDNPAAGTYTVNVKGTAVTNVQQEYFMVWDAVPRELKLTAPASGQALAPGEITKISWDAYGLTGTGTLEFSSDGGNTWSVIDTAVNVNRVVYTWTVPPVATENARVRLTKNGTGESSATGNFTILGQPVVSLAAVQCEGYTSVNWTAVAGATDYEVMLLRGTDMQPVATTAATSFTFSGLSKDSVYWATVRARLNGNPGQRAYAVSRQPATGTCAGSVSDNDVKVEAVVSPSSGRLYTATQLGTAQSVRVRIKNLDDAPATGVTVSYSVNGASVTETLPAPLAAGASLDYTFTATANLSAPGSYTLVASVHNTGDAVTANDSMTVVVKQIDNQPLNLSTPFVDNFETAVPAVYAKDTTGLGGIDRYDFSRTTNVGRSRTFVNSGFAHSGTKAVTLDADRYAPGGSVSYLLGTYNLSSYNVALNDLRLDFQFLHHGQALNAANRVWIRGSETQPWIEVYKLDSGGYEAGTYRRSASIEIANALAAAGQTFTPGFGVRWGQWGQFQATEKQLAAGYTVDDVRLYEALNDVQLVRIDNPLPNSCGLTASSPLAVTVRNASANALTNVPVVYRLAGGAPVTETIPVLGAHATVSFTFSSLPNFSQPGANALQVYVDYNADSFRENDTAAVTIYNQPVVASFPYLQNFEAGDGFYYTAGKQSSWAYGTPASPKIRGAASGAKAWKTSLEGTYNDNELSYLYSPCFDLTGLASPTLSFSVSLDVEDCGTSLCDAAWVEYSDDGISWTRLGAAGTGTNWYNKTSEQVWSVQNYNRWHVTTQPLPTGLSRLRLRFVMASDPGVAREGIAVDDIHVYDNPQGIYDGVTLASPVTQSVSGTNWVHFTSGGKLVASLQPNGATLGSTDVQAYLNTGGVRYTANQYYGNRNLTIKPANTALPDSVKVRFYFLDSEVEALRTATGCPTCTRPESAYALGVSKYTDADKAKENGTLADNAGGQWLFVAPANVVKVPFDKGYYAEFNVAGFSEFWLNNGGLNNLTPLPVKLTEFTVAKQGGDAVVKWTAREETGVARYEIEVARGNAAQSAAAFAKAGEVAAAGLAGTQRYTFTDAEPAKSGVRFYRLKIVNTDGSFVYSEVRPLLFGDAVLWQVYPNPSAGHFHLVYQAGAGEAVHALLYDAKGSLVKEYRSVGTGFLQKLNVDISAGRFAGGAYLLRVEAEGRLQSFRLYKQ